VERGRLLALKRRIDSAETLDLSELTGEVAALAAPIPGELVTAIAERVERGARPTIAAVASLIVASRNRRLYEIMREYIATDTWTLTALLRADVPDAAIERRLRDELYQRFRSSDDPRRTEILSALAEHGSTDCLDDLEAMLYEVTPRIQAVTLARKVEAEFHRAASHDPTALLQDVTRRADIEFGERLRAAVQRVRERAKPPANDWGAAVLNDHPFARSLSYIQRAEQHVAGQDYGAALNYCRKALEAALKSVIRKLNLKIKKNEPLDELQLPTLIAVVSELKLPKDIYVKITDVQRESTYGSHDQGPKPEEIFTQGMAQAAIDKYRQIEAHLAKVLTEAAP
jgi:HEPN domain-containing protein